MKSLILRTVAALATAASMAVAAQVEKRDVHIAVGGKAAFYYLPLTIAEQLGYFRDEGLNVKISDFKGGSAALRAVVGGSADVVSGAYEHTVSLQAKKQTSRLSSCRAGCRRLRSELLPQRPVTSNLSRT